MNIAQFKKNPNDLTITVERFFPAEKQMVWNAFTNGEQLARWWGPKDWPATSVAFDFRVGGRWFYCMNGPEGQKAPGLIEYTEIDAPNSFSAIDAFCDENGVKNMELPSTQWKASFAMIDQGTQMTIVLSFATEADMQKLIEMRFEEGFTDSLNNLEKYLLNN